MLQNKHGFGENGPFRNVCLAARFLNESDIWIEGHGMSEITEFPDEVQATVEKLLDLPPDQRVAIGERLIESVPPNVSPEALAEWRSRLKDIQDGREEGIPADQVLEEIRQALHEARQVSQQGARTGT